MAASQVSHKGRRQELLGAQHTATLKLEQVLMREG